MKRLGGWAVIAVTKLVELGSILLNRLVSVRSKAFFAG